MALRYRVFCPKCSGTEIDLKVVEPVPEPRRVSMDDLGTNRTTCDELMYVVKNYRATCKKCGYIKEWSE